MLTNDDHGLQCVDAGIGNRILDLVTPGTATDDRPVLEAHAEACAACRLVLDLHGYLSRDAVAMRSSTLRRPSAAIWSAWGSAAAAAACLACLLTLPPRPDGPSGVTRGADDPRFTRPVEGEVVGTQGVRVAWTAIPGADVYRLRLVDDQGRAVWTAESHTASATLSAADGLTAGTGYRLTLAAEPQDLLPPGTASVAFRAGDRMAVLARRATRPRPIVAALAAASLLLATAATVVRRFGAGHTVAD